MAEKRKITIHPKAATLEKVAEIEKEEKAETETKVSKKACYFCQAKSSPSYTDLNNLRKYLTDRAKIVPKLRSGLCSKHQRAVAKNIKYARHLSLLPFVPKV